MCSEHTHCLDSSEVMLLSTAACHPHGWQWQYSIIASHYQALQSATPFSSSLEQSCELVHVQGYSPWIQQMMQRQACVLLTHVSHPWLCVEPCKPWMVPHQTRMSLFLHLRSTAIGSMCLLCHCCRPPPPQHTHTPGAPDREDRWQQGGNSALHGTTTTTRGL